jgi:Zn-finger protein
MPCASDCPVCGDAESYINHRHSCWEEDRLKRFYNFRFPEEREKYYSRLCDSCKEGKHDCHAGARCYCPYYGCATDRKRAKKWKLKTLERELEEQQNGIDRRKSHIKQIRKEISEIRKELV